MTCIIGMDTASNRFHWVATDPIGDGTEIETIGYFGWYKTGQKEDAARIELLHESHRFFQVLPEGAHIFCEEPLALPKNGATTRLLCMAAGTIWSMFVLASPNAYWHWVDPASWKKKVLGRGTPPERGMKHKVWIRNEVMQHPEFEPDFFDTFEDQTDLYDAWCLRRYGTMIVPTLEVV